MSYYNPKKHNRRSIRLQGYDYSQAGFYFITLCVQNRINLFGKIENGKMLLNDFGKIAKTEWQKTTTIRKNCSLGEFIVMPNHFHAVISIDYQIKNSRGESQFAPTVFKSQFAPTESKSQFAPTEFKSPSHTVGAIVRGYKGAVTKQIKELFIELEKLDNSQGESKFPPIESEFLRDRIFQKKSIWQRNYWEHIIRDNRAFKNISNYIVNNPQKWEDDKLNRGGGE